MRDKKSEINLLITSVGRRNNIIRFFKEELGESGRVIAADMSELAPALYEADGYYIVPKITDGGYIDKLLSICEKEKISGVLSLIDPELSVLSKNSERFEAIGVKLLCSRHELCELAYDKAETYKFLSKKGFPCPKSYTELSEFLKDEEKKKISFPIFIKPRRSSASLGCRRIDSLDEFKRSITDSDEIIIQEYIHGAEIGADVYIDSISEKAVSIFTKRKLSMRSGETDKAVSVKDKNLYSLIERLVSELPFSGAIDIDIFEKDGEYLISEINPRLGGGYPHAHLCGCNHVRMMINNLRMKENECSVGAYRENVFMMKHTEVTLK